MTGGYDSSDEDLTSVEVLHGDGSSWCDLADFPTKRGGHTQSGLQACGGGSSYPDPSPTLVSCVTFNQGSWDRSHLLQQQRALHSAWSSPSGLVLIGGDHSEKTTELLSENTIFSSNHFPLKYETK